MVSEAEHHYIGLHQYQRGAYGLISDHETVKTAAFFVHGFWGNPDDTWMNFQWMIDSHSDAFPGWKQTDAYFFSYPSFTKSIDDSAEELLAFVKSFMAEFPDELLQVDQLLGPSYARWSRELLLPARRYGKIILIGHSEGAILIRRAIILELKRHDLASEEILNATLFLFAPAILGFTPSGLLGSALTISQLGRLVEPFLRLSPAYVEMKEGRTLAVLKSDTETMLRERGSLSCLRAHVLFGSDERVVARGEFYGDYPARHEEGKNHITICKPDPDYKRPLEFVQVEIGTAAHG